MSEFQVIAEIDEMVRRFGADRITQQAGLEQNLFALPMPSEEEYEPPPAKMRTARPIPVVRARGIDRVNVKNGAPGGVGLASSGGARNRRSSVKRFSGKKLPSTLNGNLTFSTDEYEMAQGAEAVDAVTSVLDAAGSGAGKYLARSFVSPQVATVVAGGAAINATSFGVDTANGYWAGQDYVVIRGAAVLFSFRVSDVVPEFDGGATIKIEADELCVNGIPFALVAATDTIFLLGQSSVDDRTIGSIDQLTDTSVDLYDLAQVRFPAGMRHALNAGWGHEDGRRLCSIVHQASGRWPTHWLTSPMGRDGIVNDQIDNVRYIMGQGDGADMDPYSDAMAPIFNGLPIIAEPCYDDTVVDLINADTIVLREFWPYQPRAPDGSAATADGRGCLIVDPDNVGMMALFDGGYGTVSNNRRATARFTGVTI